MKAIPKIQKYMTTTPYAINAESSIEEAAAVMSLAGFDVRHAKVKDIYEEVPYVTAPSTLVSDVSAELAERKVGSALIVDNGHLVGIFTTIDACRALNDLCQNRFG